MFNTTYLLWHDNIWERQYFGLIRRRTKHTQKEKDQQITKITLLLQLILYPVALFQQKIVITNKILHLTPKRLFSEFLLYI